MAELVTEVLEEVSDAAVEGVGGIPPVAGVAIVFAAMAAVDADGLGAVAVLGPPRPSRKWAPSQPSKQHSTSAREFWAMVRTLNAMPRPQERRYRDSSDFGGGAAGKQMTKVVPSPGAVS